MKTKRKLRRSISVETKKIAFYPGDRQKVQNCDICDENSPMLLPEVFAGLFPVSTREIYRRIEAGKVHFVEANKRQVLVCVSSLLEGTGENSLKIIQGETQTDE